MYVFLKKTKTKNNKIPTKRLDKKRTPQPKLYPSTRTGSAQTSTLLAPKALLSAQQADMKHTQ